MAGPSEPKDLALLAARGVLGGYLAAHGAQKLFGWFGGSGLDPLSGHFASIGLEPGPVMARAAGLAEFGGGIMTVLGVADPIGPTVLAGTMVVASSTHLNKGPFAAAGGYELPITNVAAALCLVVAGPGRYSLDRILGTTPPRRLVRMSKVGTVLGATATLLMVLRKKSSRQSRMHQEVSVRHTTEPGVEPDPPSTDPAA
jgi:putative oxidoreductase